MLFVFAASIAPVVNSHFPFASAVIPLVVVGVVPLYTEYVLDYVVFEYFAPVLNSPDAIK